MLAALTLLPLAAPGPALAEAVTPGPVTPRVAATTGPTGGGDLYTPIEPGVGPLPTQAGIAAAVAGLFGTAGLGGHVGGSVVDVATGETLYSSAGTGAFTPASTTKVLTAAGILATMDAQEHFRTRVVELSPPTLAPTPQATPGTAGAPPSRTLVLVGGGDPLLSSLPPGAEGIPAYPRRAYLGDLVESTVKAMQVAGVAEVKLAYDDHLFSGERSAKGWRPGYLADVIAAVSALSVDQGRIDPRGGGRVVDPASRAAAMFAEKLRAAGLKVVGKPERINAPADARQVAEVTSAPLSAIVEHMLVVSDNDVAEALARHVAIATGRPGTFDDGAAAVTAAVARLGVDMSAVSINDGSGLSRTNRIPPHALAATLAVAARPNNEKLRPMLAGLAVAGVNGTLALHYFIPKSVPGRGLVRCKTGSLTGVVSLACILPTSEGRLIAVDLVADNVQGGFGRSSRQVFERFSTALLACGCR